MTQGRAGKVVSWLGRALVVPACVAAMGALPACGIGELLDDQTDSVGDNGGDHLYVASTRIWSGRAVGVCWDTAGSATEKEWVRTSIVRTWERESGISFFGWGTCPGGSFSGVRITINDEGPHTKGLGTQLDGLVTGMVLNFTFANWSTSCQTQREFCIRAIAVHEFGHALGFAHEQNRPDTAQPCAMMAQGSNGDTTVGSWDLMSVMNYCNPQWNNGGQLSTTDRAGVRRYYGGPQDQLLAGDQNLNGRAELTLTGGFQTNATAWTTIPVAFSNGDGTFNVTNSTVSNFPGWATTTGAIAVAGDFNADGKADVALVGGIGWTTIPVAFSNGDGTFNVTNSTVTSLPGFSKSACAQPVAGDFNADGKADIALTGGAGWASVPVAFSNGDGTFNVTNSSVSNFPGFATNAGARPVAGDFNADGKADIALTGGLIPAGTAWTTVPVAFSNGDGTFNVTNSTVSTFPGFATARGARSVAGDFNNDGRADIALAGGIGWTTIPVAFSNGDGTFNVTNSTVTDFPSVATY